MRINHNISALNAFNFLNTTGKQLNSSMEKLSSGLRINRAADDAAGLAISEKMRAQIRGINRADKNVQEGVNLVQIADSALGETHQLLQRMRELAVQASNDTYNKVDREALQEELTSLTEEIEHIANSTQFNGIPLLNGIGSSTSAEIIDEIDEGNIGDSENVSKNYFVSPPDGSHLGISKLEIFDDKLDPGEYTLEIERITTHTTGATLNGAGGSDIWYGAFAFEQASLRIQDLSLFPDGNYALTPFVEPRITNFNPSGGISRVQGYPITPFPKIGWPQQDETNRGRHENDTHFKIEVTGETNNRTIAIYNSENLKIAEETGVHDNAASEGLKITPLVDKYGQFEIHSDNLTNTDGNPASFDTEDSNQQFVLINANTREVVDSLPPLEYVPNSTINLWDLGSVETTNSFTHNLSFYFSVASNYKVNLIDSDGNYVVRGEPVAQNKEDVVLGKGGFDVPYYEATGISYDTTMLTPGTMKFTIANDQTPIEEVGNGNDEEKVNERASAQFILQVGPNTGNKFYVNIDDMRSNALGISKSSNLPNNLSQGSFIKTDSEIEYVLDISSGSNIANSAIEAIDKAISDVSEERGRLGTYQRGLEHISNNLENYDMNLQAAESRIRDTDMARELMEQTKSSILSKASQAMLAQANQLPQGVLQLLG